MANKLQKLVVAFFILALCIGAPAWGQEEAEKTPADLRDEKFAAIQKELAEKSDEEKIKESNEILDDLSRTIKAEENEKSDPYFWIFCDGEIFYPDHPGLSASHRLRTSFPGHEE